MEAISIVAALMEKQAEEMVSAGTSQEAALLWFEPRAGHGEALTVRTAELTI